MSYLEFGTGNISPQSFTFGQAFFITCLSLLFRDLHGWQHGYGPSPVHHAKACWRIYVNFGSLFSQILEGFFFSEVTFHAIFMSCSLLQDILSFILLLANRSKTKSWTEIYQKNGTLRYLKCFSKRMTLDNKLFFCIKTKVWISDMQVSQKKLHFLQ